MQEKPPNLHTRTPAVSKGKQIWRSLLITAAITRASFGLMTEKPPAKLSLEQTEPAA